MIIQMMGRAGRIGYNNEGHVYIMTTSDQKVSKKNCFYLELLDCINFYLGENYRTLDILKTENKQIGK